MVKSKYVCKQNGFKSKGGATYDNLSSQMMWMVMDVVIDGNGRDGGVEKRRYSSNLFSFFSLLLFLSFSFLFLLPFSLPFSFSLLFCFCNILQNFKRVYMK